MYGDKLAAVGIIVWYGYKGNGEYGWWAKVKYQDFGHCDRGSVMGNIRTKYADSLQYSIDTIKRDAEKIGIEFVKMDGLTPAITYLNDGEWGDYPPPDGWRESLLEEAIRIGFIHPYRED